jgi:hypothetical protein
LTANIAPALEGLTPKQRLYVEATLKGMPDNAARAVAGYKCHHNKELNDERVQAAVRGAQAISAAHTEYTREKMAEMLMEAWRVCADAREMVMVVNSLSALFGLNAPKKLHIDQNTTTTHKFEDLRSLSTEELIKLVDKSDAIDVPFEPVKQLEHHG